MSDQQMRFTLEVGDQEFTTRFIKKHGTDKYVLANNFDKCRTMFDAIVEASKPKVKEVLVCPLCERKIEKNVQKYQPTREMVDILFEMVRIMRSDPKQRGYVKMVERPEKLSDEDQIIGTVSGIKQNHKMRLLGLISFVDTNLQQCERTAKHIRAAYTITQKGMDLLSGLPISPWQIHVQGSKAVLLDEDKQTSGSIRTVRDFTYEEWKSCAVSIGLQIPDD